MTYAERLQDPRWDKKRKEILKRDCYTCRNCGTSNEELHVHHIKYFSEDPWDCPDIYLITLCKSCHATEEDLKGADFYKIMQDVGLTRLEFINIQIALYSYFCHIPVRDINAVEDLQKIINPSDEVLQMYKERKLQKFDPHMAYYLHTLKKEDQ
jgi:hypothetical protein